MEYLRWIVSGGVMLGVLVVIHEFGHFLVARLFGVGTPIFSIGIGPRLFGFRLFDTDFRVSALPVGGYVLMSGADPFGEEDPDTWVEPEKDFMRKPIWQRLLIMLAGPGMNLALPFVLFTAVMMLGQPQLSSVIRTVFPYSPASELGLQLGDKVVEAAGVEIEVWSDLERVLDHHAAEAIPLKIARGNEVFDVVLPAGAVQMGRDGQLDPSLMGFSPRPRSTLVGVPDPTSPAGVAGIRTGDGIVEVDGQKVNTWEELEAALSDPKDHTLLRVRAVDGEARRDEVQLHVAAWQPPADRLIDIWGLEHPSTYVGTVQAESAAEKAGVRVGDRIEAVDGTPVRVWSDVLKLVAKTTDAPPDSPPGTDSTKPRALRLELLRAGERLTLEFEPEYTRQVLGSKIHYRPLMGVSQYLELHIPRDLVRKYYGFPEASSRAIEETGILFTETMQTLGNLVSGKVMFTEVMGGPIAILQAAGESAKNGVLTFVHMMGMISLSLGIVNLLPIPVLDGGQILFYAFEGIRGRPLPLVWRERIQMVAVLMLAALMLVISVNDVSRFFTG